MALKQSEEHSESSQGTDINERPNGLHAPGSSHVSRNISPSASKLVTQAIIHAYEETNNYRSA